jgi:hypothetical protein
MVRITRADVESADFVAEGTREEIQLTLRAGKLPKLRLTDNHGVQHFKTVAFADLLAILEHSTVLEQLRQADVHPVRIPHELPRRATLVSYVEKANRDTEYVVVSGVIEPTMRGILLQREGRTFIYDVDLGEIGWCVSWYPFNGQLRDMGVYLIRGRTMEGFRKLYRYPLSNVSGAAQACWPTRSQETYELRDVPHAVEIFIGSIPNSAHMYGLGRSHNAPTDNYADFLEEIEAMEEVPDDWLIPLGMTEQEVHDGFIERTAIHG